MGEEKRRKISINPFETESYHSKDSRNKPYGSSNNPFQDASFERKSKGSQASESNPFEKATDQPSNPFDKSTDQPSNPFEKSSLPSSPHELNVRKPSS